MINEVIKKLRKAADALDELMDVMPSANIRAARSIRTKVDRNLKEEMAYGKTPILLKTMSTKKKHWTQTKAGKKKMSLAQKAMWARRKEAK